MALRSNNLIVTGSNNEVMIQGTQDHSVDLSYDNAVRFQTSGIGVTVIGQVDATSAVLDDALTVNGTANLNGNVVLGNATSDTITVGGQFDSNLVPDITLTYDLGTDSRRWNTAYIRNIDGLTNLNTEFLFVAGIATFKDDVEFHGKVGVTSVFWDKSEDEWKYLDHVKTTWGNDGDLKILNSLLNE